MQLCKLFLSLTDKCNEGKDFVDRVRKTDNYVSVNKLLGNLRYKYVGKINMHLQEEALIEN